MNDFPKVLVVDDGERNADRALSAELAELGFASVTASLEAADDVLELIPSPAAIFVQVPEHSSPAQQKRFMDLAERLKAREGETGVPVIVVEGSRPGGYAAALQGPFAHAFSSADR
jgi:CheY-like chemotaxis protein